MISQFEGGRWTNLRSDSACIQKRKGTELLRALRVGGGERILGAAACVKHAEGTAAVTPYQHHCVLSLGDIGEGLLDIGSTLRRTTVHADDDLSGLETSFFGGAAGLNALDNRSLQVFRCLQLLANIRSKVRNSDSPARLAVVAVGRQLVFAVSAAHLVRCDGNGNALAIAQDIERDLGSG